MQFLNDILGDEINVNVNVEIDPKSSAILGTTIFISILLALVLAGLILKKI